MTWRTFARVVLILCDDDDDDDVTRLSYVAVKSFKYLIIMI